MPSQMYADVHTKPWAAKLPHMPFDELRSPAENAAGIRSWLTEHRSALSSAAAETWPDDVPGISARVEDLLLDLENVDRDYEVDEALERLYDLADYLRVFLAPPPA